MPKAKRIAKAMDFKVPDLVGNLDAPTLAPSQIRILISTLDFTLILAELRIKPDGNPIMQETARVHLSPQHAKSLAILLTSKVIEYENEVGVINLPVAESAEDEVRGAKPSTSAQLPPSLRSRSAS